MRRAWSKAFAERAAAECNSAFMGDRGCGSPVATFECQRHSKALTELASETPPTSSVGSRMAIQRHCLPFSGAPEKSPKNEKNEGPFYLTSVSLAFCSPSAVASMTVNSFSSIVLSSLLTCWRRSLSPFCLSG